MRMLEMTLLNCTDATDRRMYSFDARKIGPSVEMSRSLWEDKVLEKSFCDRKMFPSLALVERDQTCSHGTRVGRTVTEMKEGVARYVFLWKIGPSV